MGSISADGRTIGVGSIEHLDGLLVGGELIVATGERRMIVSQTGTSIVVNFPYSTIAVDADCTIAAGCDMAWDGDCKNKFDNQERFGGFRHIPPENVFVSGIDPGGEGVEDTACVFTPVSNAWYGEMTFDFTPGELPLFAPNIVFGTEYPSGGIPYSGNFNAQRINNEGGGHCQSVVYRWWPEGSEPDGSPSVPFGDPFVEGPPTIIQMTCQFISVTNAFSAPPGLGLLTWKLPNGQVYSYDCANAEPQFRPYGPLINYFSLDYFFVLVGEV